MIAQEDAHNNRQAGAALQQALNTWGRGQTLMALQPLPQAVQNLVWAESLLRTLDDVALPVAVTEHIQHFPSCAPARRSAPGSQTARGSHVAPHRAARQWEDEPGFCRGRGA